MGLQNKLDELKKQIESQVPSKALAVMHGATDDLLHSGIMDRVLSVGERAPQFSLPDTHGRLINSNELLNKGPLVVSFYRGVW